MFQKCIVTLGILMLVGCAGTSFTLDNNPILNQMLLACGDKPVAEFDACVKEEFAKAPGADSMTVNDAIEILRALQPTPEVPVE
jgi:hypothetical protein